MQIFQRILLILVISIVALMATTILANAYPTVYPSGVTIHDSNSTYDGFTLFTPLNGDNSAGSAGVVYLVDMEGNIVHQWNTSYVPNAYGYLLPDGHLLYLGKPKESLTSSNYTSRVIQELDWNGTVVWSYEKPGMHHDACRMPNGDTLVVISEQMPAEYVQKVKGGISGTELNGTDMFDDAILQVSPNGTIVWEWHAFEHLDPDYYTLDGQDLRREWTHMNTVEYLPAGNSYNGRESILTSFRQTDTIVIIDMETKNITWSWGKGYIKHQHDPTLLSNGNILVFDNGAHRPGFLDYSRIVEVDPKSGQIVWEYTEDKAGTHFFSTIISGAGRLPNNNTIICEGLTGRIFEVTPDKRVVWEYINPYKSNTTMGNAIFRAYRYGSADISWPVDMPPANPAKAVDVGYPGSVDQVVEPFNWQLPLLIFSCSLAVLLITGMCVLLPRRKE